MTASARLPVRSNSDPAPGSGRVSVVDAGSGDLVEIPGGHLLLGGYYAREGMDLWLVGQGGEAALVWNYFAQSPRPNLINAEGSVLTPDIVEAMVALPAAAARPTLGPADPVGLVDGATGEVFFGRADGTRLAAEKDTPLYSGDAIETGAGRVALVMVDGTRLALGEGTRAQIEHVVTGPQQLHVLVDLLELVDGTRGVAFLARLAKIVIVSIVTTVASRDETSRRRRLGGFRALFGWRPLHVIPLRGCTPHRGAKGLRTWERLWQPGDDTELGRMGGVRAVVEKSGNGDGWGKATGTAKARNGVVPGFVAQAKIDHHDVDRFAFQRFEGLR